MCEVRYRMTGLKIVLFRFLTEINMTVCVVSTNLRGEIRALINVVLW